MKLSYVIAGLLVAAASGLAAYAVREPQSAADEMPGVSPVADFDASAALRDRVLALEAAVSAEREARQLLEEELQALYGQLERLAPKSETPDADLRERALRDERIAAMVRQFRDMDSTEGRVAMLVEAGFALDRAEWITRRESELRMEALQAQFDARRAGEEFNPFAQRLSAGNALRTEIGDAEFEQYLEASGRPVTVTVGSVLEASPGQRAGLQPGDEIVRYDGQRVFNTQDLNGQTVLGEPGEPVVVELLRDGGPMQIVLPRGPIGVTTGRFRDRR
jgi:hypothetical protein